MERHSTATDGDGEYDYADDFTDDSDDNELPLPGLHDQGESMRWPGDDDWRLPGLLAQGTLDNEAGDAGRRPDRSDDSSSAEVLLEDEPQPRTIGAGPSRPMAAADAYPRNPWVLQRAGAPDLAATLPRGSSPGHFAASQRRSSSILHSLRRAPPSPFRTSAASMGPLGSSSSSGGGGGSGGGGFRQRDSLPALQQQQSQPAGFSMEHRASNQHPQHAYQYQSMHAQQQQQQQQLQPQYQQQQRQQYRQQQQQQPQQQQDLFGGPPPSRQQLLPPVQLRQLQPPQPQQQHQPLLLRTQPQQQVPQPQQHQQQRQFQPQPPLSRQPDSRGSGSAMQGFRSMGMSLRDSSFEDPLRGRGAAAADEGMSSSGAMGGGGGGGGGGGSGWPTYLIVDPYARALSSSCSSSASASPSASPLPRHFTLQAPSSSGQQHWYGTQYSNSQYEQDFGLGLGLGLGRGLGGGEDSAGLMSRDGGEGMSLGLVDHRLSGYGLGLGLVQDAAADRSLSSSDSSRSSRSRTSRPSMPAGHGTNHGRGHRWDDGVSASASGTGGRYDPGQSRSSGGGAAAAAGGSNGSVVHLPPLWPSGGLGEERRLGSAASSSTAAGAGWRPPPLEIPRGHHLAAGSVSGSLSGRWRPSLDDDAGTALGSPAGGSGIPQLRSVGEPGWERRYGGIGGGAGYGLAHGIGRSTSSSSSTPGRYSARSGLGSGGLGGGGMGGTLGGGSGGAQNDSRGSASGSGLSRGGLSSGGARCFASLDSSSGQYERRRAVLGSASRRMQPPLTLEPVAPAVRQYGDGFAGMLTNAQIQEWMSQHASRLLLPRHMHEIADIVFRPPSAVPEKKPPKCQPETNSVTTLSPPVILGGRYPPLHISRLASDPGFITSLLSGLEGVDPNDSGVQAVVTALQGRDVTARDEDLEPGRRRLGQQQPPQQSAAAAAAALAGKPGRPGSGMPARC
ncbi:hypothetical protein Agub_g102 [Astrephomene gubernaculifera]|uniref:Uncharacterized protein n=1 Tax=Astrephomene gubernaculifera TaxID=47775 RepID=A0AAD3HGF1_9CHLO|nr:hypothetical protein Agub_g102 [Astrephomene gubernaculifera]